ncbi:hypothetical protein VCO01S_16960 [Vibrio comitans NBRC 102076]|uniref:Uncharacterized protein n=1 Tax=Vibrio comitans NBRC 102076 TaxID=1219078 RepID=A0A4Y3ILY1_9VIBR|nr:hypothetical protein VCO01S_16960 [Vibrio comitans NBRC 102076]
MQNLDRWVYKECLTHNYLALNGFVRTSTSSSSRTYIFTAKTRKPPFGALINQENRLTMNVCNGSMIELKLVAHS